MQTIDTPQAKTKDEAGRPIRYVTSVMFRDRAGAEWLRHEYVRCDEPLSKEKIVMEFEYLGIPARKEPLLTRRKKSLSQRQKIRAAIRKFNR